MSLRRRLLVCLLPLMLLTMSVELWSTQREALAAANSAYDRSIRGALKAIEAKWRKKLADDEATIVDLANKNVLMEKAGDKFHVLPGVSQPASDETLFGRIDWIQKNDAQREPRVISSTRCRLVAG